MDDGPEHPEKEHCLMTDPPIEHVDSGSGWPFQSIAVPEGCPANVPVLFHILLEVRQLVDRLTAS